ncbi:MAG TPA: TonB family protein [Xanthobacteraceae bacterium]|nr:TonB family protein [Xanthobacteraceae bacterium]
MSAAALPFHDGMRPLEAARWLAAGALVLGLHAAAAMGMLRLPAAPAPMEPPAVMIELAPLPVAPAAEPVDLPPGPTMAEAPEPEPREVPPDPLARVEDAPPPPPAPEAVEPLPEVAETTAPNIEVPLPPPLPLSAELTPPEKPIDPPKQRPKPKPKPKERSERPPAPRTSAAPSSNAAPAPRAAAPTVGTTASRSVAPATWRSQLMAHLNRFKRYPGDARGRGEQGRPRVAFTIDRSGRVLAVRLVGGSGSSSLDGEAVAMVHRASPVPAPPADMAGGSFNFTVPVLFNMR